MHLYARWDGQDKFLQFLPEGHAAANITVLDDIFDIPSHDREDEYLNVLVAMINGYESKLFYNTFCEAYDEGRFNDSLEENEIL